MQREVLHPLHCPCSRCRAPAERPALHPDIAPIVHGLAAGIAFGALLAAVRFGPALLDWIRA